MNRLLFASKWGVSNEEECLNDLDNLLKQQYNQAMNDAIHQVDNNLAFHCSTTEVIDELKTLKK